MPGHDRHAAAPPAAHVVHVGSHATQCVPLLYVPPGHDVTHVRATGSSTRGASHAVQLLAVPSSHAAHGCRHALHAVVLDA